MGGAAAVWCAAKLVSLLRALHETVHVTFDVDGVVCSLLSIIGVKQGDLLGPDLFIFFMAAVMETWRSVHSYELCIFRTRDDFKMTGRPPMAHGEEFAITDSEYADDTALPFPSLVSWEDLTLRLVPAYSSAACIDGDARWLSAWHSRSLEAMRRKGLAAFHRHMDYRLNPTGVASALLVEVAARRRLG